jgi:hypothetical protein
VLAFHAYINEMQVSRAKSPVKMSSGSVARRDLIPAFKGLIAVDFCFQANTHIVSFIYNLLSILNVVNILSPV